LTRCPPRSSIQAFIRIQRTSQFTALFTPFEVYIDDRKVGALGNHEQGQYEVEPGAHTLYLKVDNFKSKPIPLRLDAGETSIGVRAEALGVGINVASVVSYCHIYLLRYNLIL
jgi:hypothetical protein